MEKLKMHTPDLAEENYKKLAALFPDAVTETITGYDEKGRAIVERAIDKDVLMQEINAQVVDDGQERYQFTWPDKRKSVVLANAPIAKTLRFEQKKSVGRDGTPGVTDSENIYIEGDNLDALKLLQETYLGKVKMIYIDPPYNTGSDAFVYDDDSSISNEEFSNISGQQDDEGNLLFDMRPNNETNGRFHTDWLNMLYPRIRLATDLLKDDGIIFISIDDNELGNLKKICDEIFGADNFITIFIWEKRKTRENRRAISVRHDYIICYVKNFEKRDQALGLEEMTGDAVDRYKNPDNDPRGPWTSVPAIAQGGHGTKNQFYTFVAPNGNKFDPPSGSCWRYTWSKMQEAIADNRIWFGSDGNNVPRIKKFLTEGKQGMTPESLLLADNVGTNDSAKRELVSLFNGTAVFETPKPVSLLKHLISITADGENGLFLDFFSGTATFAHAIFEKNAEDQQKRRFLLVQLPEVTDDDSEAYKAGYKTICDIGEERIRRAGKKIKEETGADIDYGFRCFKVDSSNMKDVYYRPADIGQMNLDQFTDNIKEDRTPEDLLIQVMLDLGVLLSSKVEQTEIAGKKVFSVDDGYLIACFDKDVTEDVVTEIAKKHPFYAVFRDSSMANDSVAANFEQIFDTYSPQTVRKVL